MDQISYKLDVFEGPMDLLLSLIAKHKLNIYAKYTTEGASVYDCDRWSATIT